MDRPENPVRPRRWFWLKRLAIFLAGALFVFGIGVWILTKNLTLVTRWAVQRALPAARAEIGGVSYEGGGRLVVKKFVLRDRVSGVEYLRIDRGEVIFSFEDFHRRQLGEIRLVNPFIRISPGLFRILPSGEADEEGPLPPWAARRIVCDYGEVLSEGFGPTSPSVRLKCAFDWTEPGADSVAPLEMIAWDVRVWAPGYSEAFLVLDRVDLAFTVRGLLTKREVDGVQVAGGRLILGSALQQVLSGPPTSSQAALGTNPAASWIIRKLGLQGLGVRLEDKRKIAADITFQIHTTLTNLSLTQATSTIGAEEQTVEIADVEILSPYDPLTKVITLRNMAIRFTLAGLLRGELAQVAIREPAIHVGPDLFWYMEDTQKQLAGNASPGPNIPWKISQLLVTDGRLIVGSSGRAKYGLPLNFQARAQDLALDNLAALKMRTVFEIPAQTTDFPSYQLAVVSRQGDLQFAYPPEKNENNLVGKIFFDSIRWRQYQAADAWLSATFDQEGINGDFGGRAYGGYLSGGFSFLFRDEAPWIGWLSGSKVDLKRLTDSIAPQNFRMTGPLNFKLQMDAFGRRIERVKGKFHAVKPGRMKIGKLDDLLANIPTQWSRLKQSGTRLALEALRDFEYTKAGGDLWFVDNQGIFGLELQGPQGSRNLDIVFHADESPEGRWKIP
ncbi:MAG: hypothetical protein IAE94_02850 [Chthoniobacterales bacterium]|nr:hypothetical protein [Chthoniobacterales bacterium]